MIARHKPDVYGLRLFICGATRSRANRPRLGKEFTPWVMPSGEKQYYCQEITRREP